MFDAVLSGGNIVDIVSKRIYKGDILIKDGKIADITLNCTGENLIDVSKKYIVPGFIDSHLHIESSMLTPIEFSKTAVKHGTTSIFVDPHEIANISGRKGIELFLNQSTLIPLDMFIGIPSCVPPTPLEDSGSTISIQDIEELVQDRRVFGLAEMMNFPAIVHGLGNARKKVDIVYDYGKIVDGHCPGISANTLRSYITNGRNDGIIRITSDHECSTIDEVVEKYNAGMHIMLRYGSTSKDLDRILPYLVRRNYNLDNFSLCSDDLDPVELYENGHVDRIIKRARDIILENSSTDVSLATMTAISLATVNPAKYFSKFFKRHAHPETGEIAIGKKANLNILNSLEDLHVEKVMHNGRLIVDDGGYTANIDYDYSGFSNSMNVGRKFSPSDFKVRINSGEKSVNVKVIEPYKGIETKLKILPFEVRENEIMHSPGIAKIAVIERHKQTGDYCVGFVKSSIQNGAIASTVAHDTHNLVVIGVDDNYMAKAANYLSEKGGGMVVVGDTIDYLPLRISGLMSAENIESVSNGYIHLKKAAERIGASSNIFMTISFLTLPVIPELRITAKGLVDVYKFDFVSLY